MNETQNIPQWKERLYLFSGILLIIILVFTIFWIHYNPIRDYWVQQTVMNRGIQTQALLNRSEHSSSSKSGLDYYTFHYTYTVEEQSYSHNRYVTHSHFSSYKEGNEFTVLYLPENPEISDLPDNYGYENDMMSMIVLDLFVLLFILIALIRFIWKKLKKRKRKDEDILDAGFYSSGQ